MVGLIEIKNLRLIILLQYVLVIVCCFVLCKVCDGFFHVKLSFQGFLFDCLVCQTQNLFKSLNINLHLFLSTEQTLHNQICMYQGPHNYQKL